MDERDIELIRNYPLGDRDWTPDELTDWREQVDRFTKRDQLGKEWDKKISLRDEAIDMLLGLHVLQKKLNEKEWEDVRSLIRRAREEDRLYWLSHGINLDEENFDDR